MRILSLAALLVLGSCERGDASVAAIAAGHGAAAGRWPTGRGSPTAATGAPFAPATPAPYGPVTAWSDPFAGVPAVTPVLGPVTGAAAEATALPATAAAGGVAPGAAATGRPARTPGSPPPASAAPGTPDTAEVGGPSGPSFVCCLRCVGSERPCRWLPVTGRTLGEARANTEFTFVSNGILLQCGGEKEVVCRERRAASDE